MIVKTNFTDDLFFSGDIDGVWTNGVVAAGQDLLVELKGKQSTCVIDKIDIESNTIWLTMKEK